jgi:hypothetical protein
MAGEPPDFERQWQAKLARAIEAAAGGTVSAKVTAGGEELSSQSSPERIVEWSRGAMDRLTAEVGRSRAGAILTACACRYPETELQTMRKKYLETGEVDAARGMLQAGFETMLRRTLKLPEGKIAEVVRRGWGPAGVRAGRVITATKIPHSENLAAYLDEPDPIRRRALYCHCPRVQGAAARGEKLPGVYCYCGAGYYRAIWETILRQPVEVELLESVLQGGDVCRVAIRLPAGTPGTEP